MKIKNLIIPLFVGGAVYYFFKGDTILLNGSGGGSNVGGGSNDDGGSNVDGGSDLKKVLSIEQIDFINTLDNTEPTQINTTTLNNYTRNTITTSKKNIKAVESLESFRVNTGTDTTFLYKDKNNKIIGGSDFGTNQSLTKKSAENVSNTRTNPIVTISRQIQRTPIRDVKKDYENKNKVSTTVTKKQISSFKYLTGGL